LGRAFGLLGLGGIGLLLSLTIGHYFQWILLGLSVGLLAAGIAVGIKNGANVRFYASPESREEAILAELLADLDRKRSSQGLDRTLSPEVLARLEQAAFAWERIETMRSTEHWKEYPSLSGRVAAKASQLMNKTLIDHLARPSTDLAMEGADPADQLQDLAKTMDAANAELLTYARPSDLINGIPIPSQFPAHTRLEQLTDGTDA